MARMSREVREARAIITAQHQLERRLGTIAFEKNGELAVTWTPADGISLKETPALGSGE
jgi:hypothetical protein